MNVAKIIEIRRTPNNELLLKIESDGKPGYQYIYREAGVRISKRSSSYFVNPYINGISIRKIHRTHL